MKKNLSSRLIVLDGPDGCGKSTQCRMLVKWIVNSGTPVTGLRDPGTTQIGEKIRAILLDVGHETMATPTEVLLYMAARAQLWHEQIEPAMRQGKCVVLDRWLSSTCAYQGGAGGFGMEKIVSIASHVLPQPWPDLTVILDMDSRTAASRIGDQPDRMEQKGAAYHQRVRQGFLDLASARRDFAIVDASGSIKTVHEKVVDIVLSRL